MRQVATFGAMAEAQTAKSYLRSQGIAAELPDEHTLALSGGVDVALGWYRLLVPDEQAHAAITLLGEAEAGRTDRATCECCGASAFSPIRSWGLPSPLRALDALLPFGPPTDAERCQRCGHVQARERADEREPT